MSLEIENRMFMVTLETGYKIVGSPNEEIKAFKSLNDRMNFSTLYKNLEVGLYINFPYQFVSMKITDIKPITILEM